MSSARLATTCRTSGTSLALYRALRSRIGGSPGTRPASTSHRSSRTRLTEELSAPPSARRFKGKKFLEVAPREPRPQFSRDSAPHAGARESGRDGDRERDRDRGAARPARPRAFAQNSSFQRHRAPPSKGKSTRPGWGARPDRDQTAHRPRSSAPFSKPNDAYRARSGPPFSKPTDDAYRARSGPPFPKPAEDAYRQRAGPPFSKPTEDAYRARSGPPFSKPAEDAYRQRAGPPFPKPAEDAYRQRAGPPFSKPNDATYRPRSGAPFSRPTDAAYRPRSDAPPPSFSRPSFARTQAQEAASQIEAEFDFSTPAGSTQALPTRFAAPPLLDGFVQSLRDILGPDARPTPIQALSLKHLFADVPAGQYRQFLLASETGSGKSLAYMLPMLQALKQSEPDEAALAAAATQHALNPRALVLAPTHELARQLTSFAKALIHNVKLRVQGASRANVPSSARAYDRRGAGMRASKMADAFRGGEEGAGGEFEVSAARRSHPVDVLVGTPSKILELVKGRGWDRVDEPLEAFETEPRRVRRPGRPEIGLANVEWVVVDEADILFDADFLEETRLLLSDIAAARGHPVPAEAAAPAETPTTTTPAPAPVPYNYPFHLILTSATIPVSLATHLRTHHPSMTRLASPRLHKLPAKLKLEFAAYTSGNRNADVEKKIREIWAEEALRGQEQSQIVVFGNKRTRVEEQGKFLTERGVANVVVTGNSGRSHGSNRHLEGFLKPLARGAGAATAAAAAAEEVSGATGVVEEGEERAEERARILLSTSLLARGLDFAPSVRHIVVLEAPRNTADFLHRAGRTARAGMGGRVIVFGKMEGRGSEKVKELRRNVEALKLR